MKYFSACVAALPLLASSLASVAHADVFDDLRQKWKDDVVCTATVNAYQNDPTYAAGIASRLASIRSLAVSRYQAMNKTASRTYLWSNVTSTTSSAALTSNYLYIADMTHAAVCPGLTWPATSTSTEPSLADLKAAVVGAMDWMYANRYKADTTAYDNWWDWQIGCPQHITDIMADLYESFTPAQIDHYSASLFDHVHPSINDDGANGTWQAKVWMLLGIVRKNRDINGKAHDYLAEVKNVIDTRFTVPLPIGTETDAGLFWDGSFIMHERYAYNGGYAISYLNDLVTMETILNASSWAPAAASITNLVPLFSTVYDNFMFDDICFGDVQGRYIASTPQSIPDITGNVKTLTNAALRLAQIDSNPTDRLQLGGLVKEWNLCNPQADIVDGLNTQTFQLFLGVMNDDAYLRRGPLNGYTQYPEIDRCAVQRPAWAASVAMYSLDTTGGRMLVASNETLNAQTLLGAHRSDGALQLLNADVGQYNSDYYGNIDWAALPGTTVASGIAIPSGGAGYTNGSNWAGGAGADEFGVSGFELMPTETDVFGSLHALKGWFFFDQEIVCLGSDIRKTSNAETHPFHTIVEQWKLNPGNSNVFTVDGVAEPTTDGWSATGSATWANLGGSVAGTDTGYYFPASQNIVASRHLGADGKTSLLNMYIDHGVPTAGSYEYVLLPCTDATGTRTYASAPPITILENSADAQAVQKASIGVTEALFWKAQGKTVTLAGASAIQSNLAAAVVVHKSAGALKIGVSDPSQSATAGSATIQIWPNVTGNIIGVASADTGVTVLQTKPTLKLQVAFNGTSGGRKFTVGLRTADAPAITTQPISQEVAAGASATFKVVVSGWSPFSYQWYKDGGAIPGAVGAAYTVNAATAADAGSYDVVVGNSVAAATSASATLTVDVPAVASPAIVTPPTARSAVPGASATFSVLATGGGTLSYQWHKDGVAISGATGASYTIAPVASSDAGAYDVSVSNSAGSVTSRPVLLTIDADLSPAVVTCKVGGTGIMYQGQSKPRGKVIFTRTGDTTDDLIIHYRVRGSAVNGTDYVGNGGMALTGTAVIPAGSSRLVVKLLPAGGSQAGPTETVKITLLATSTDAYTVGTESKAKLTLKGND